MARDEKEVYDGVYDTDDAYATPHKAKIDYVCDWAERNQSGFQGDILDAGCGRGEYIRALKDRGLDAYGVELSTVCCDEYLSDLDHNNLDILEFCELSMGYEYSLIYSTDVLEHIPPVELDATLEAIQNIGRKFLFLVCTGSDVKNGHELHLSNHTFEEWTVIIEQHFMITKSIKGFDEWPYIHIFECEKYETNHNI